MRNKFDMKIAILLEAPLQKVLISDKTMEKLKALGEVSLNETDQTDKETLKSVLKDADIAVSSWGTPVFDKEFLDCAPSLKMIAHAAGSVKSIVSDELYNRGIKVSSCASVLSRGVSETAIGLTIAASKDFFHVNAIIHQGGWETDLSRIKEMCDITIGVVGCGFSGAHYIELLQNYDVDILVYDPYLTAEQIAEIGGRKADLDMLFRESDILSLHAPMLESTKHIVNADTLKMMKDDAILINTARGSLVDEEALAACMRAGKLKYACLDVADPEPMKKDSPLRSIHNCILTPHIAGCVNNGKLKIGKYAYEEILRYKNGEPLQTEIKQEMLYTIA